MKQILSALWKKMFFSPYFFTIALRRRTTDSIVSDPHFHADFVFPATYKDWCADPILVDYDDKTYLFYEAVKGAKGRLEVVQVFDDCTLSTPTVILEDNCHYSYPFVFSFQSDWYMIPESSASEEVRLYRATDFPREWELVTILLKQKSVDTTVFIQNGTMFLLTFLLCPGTEQVLPQAYRMNWTDSAPDLVPIPWDDFDMCVCRGAGPVFSTDQICIRPAQLNNNDQYGNAVLFFRPDTAPNRYSETVIGALTPDHVHAKKMWLDGLHTYSVSDKFEAIDIRCREFEFGKLLRILRNKIKKK